MDRRACRIRRRVRQRVLPSEQEREIQGGLEVSGQKLPDHVPRVWPSGNGPQTLAHFYHSVQESALQKKRICFTLLYLTVGEGKRAPHGQLHPDPRKWEKNIPRGHSGALTKEGRRGARLSVSAPWGD